tara:strand:- start:220 stop:387 length:168 start_codon:yes stop_codon:yes gene_type:complete
MNQPINDKTVIIILLATIFIVFILIFSTVKGNNKYNDSIQWKESTNSTTQNIIYK